MASETKEAVRKGDTIEDELALLAAYHVGLFAGAASRIDGSVEVPAVIAHGLFLLIEEAKRRREEWLGS